MLAWQDVINFIVAVSLSVYLYASFSLPYTPCFVCRVLVYSEGSVQTPAHDYGFFKFKTYATLAFRHFREDFDIKADDFLVSLGKKMFFGCVVLLSCD